MNKIIITVSLLFSFFLVSCSQSKLILSNEIRVGNLESVIKITDNLEDLNSSDEKGASPLHHACYYGHYDIVKYLIEKGAEVNIEVPNYGLTPLHGVAMNGSIKIAKFLAEHGANVNAMDHVGATPIIMACWIGNLDLIKYLRGQGAIIDSRLRNGETALHKAVSNGNLGVVNYLVSEGLEVNVASLNGLTPLHMATACNNELIVKILIENGAQYNIPIVEDFSFFRCLNAPILKDEDVFEVSIGKGKTAYQIAVDNSYKNILETFKSSNLTK